MMKTTKQKRYKDQYIDEDDWAFKFTKKKNLNRSKPPKRKDYHPRVYKKKGQKIYCCKTVDENQTEDELLTLMKQNKWTLQDEILGENDEHVFVFYKWE